MRSNDWMKLAEIMTILEVIAAILLGIPIVIITWCLMYIMVTAIIGVAG